MGATGYFTHSDCRLHEMGEGHPECPQRLDAIEDRLLITGLDHALDRREPAPASLADIELAHGRMYAENEMVILHGVGVSEWYVTRVTLILAVINMLFTGYLSLYVAPWAEEQQNQVLEKAQSEAGLAALVQLGRRTEPLAVGGGGLAHAGSLMRWPPARRAGRCTGRNPEGSHQVPAQGLSGLQLRRLCGVLWLTP